MAKTKKVTDEQVQQLFAFVEKKRVRHYDMQIELVDHLACSIEELWMEKPELTFEQALQQIYKRFGITGFSKILQEKRKALEKQTWRWIGQFYLSWLKLPKLFLTIALLFSATQLLLWLDNPMMVIQITLLGIIFSAFFFFIKNWFVEGWHKKSKKLLYVEATSSAYGAIGGLGGLMFQVPELIWQESTVSVWRALLMVIFFFVAILFVYVVYLEIPRKVKTHVRQHFPKFA